MTTRLMIPAALALAATLSGCDKEPEQQVSGEVALRSFADCDELREYAAASVLDQMLQSRYSSWGWGWLEDDMAEGADAPTASDGDNGAPRDYTTTNVQEEGVDEVDIVKTNGTHIFALEGNQLHVVDSWPVEDAKLLKSIDLGTYSYGHGMFLHDDTVVVFSNFYDYNGNAIFNDRSWGGTRVTWVDVSDPANATVTRTQDFEGYFASGRMVDDQAYMVLNTYLPMPEGAWELLWRDDLGLPEMDWNASEAEQERIREQARDILEPLVDRLVADLDDADLLPMYRDGDGDVGVLEECSNVYRPAQTTQYAVMSVVQLDLSDGDMSATGILSNGWTLYASQQNLYVAQTSWWWWWGWGDLDLSSHIHKFALTDDGPVYTAAGKVDGWLLNQFSMSEYDGKLRVASTETDWWWGTEAGEEEPGSNVTVLEDDGNGELAQIGKLDGIAPGEQITAVRMMGDVGYVVTFEWVDPLFTVDLSDPTAPAVLGELKLPGFSTYLHPMGEDHLLAVGYDGEEDGTINGLAVSIFDVSDLSEPKLAHQFTLQSDDWSYSEALWDHHAFTYHNDVLSIPVYTYDYDQQSGEYAGFSGLLVLDATPEGISERGRIGHQDMAADSACGYGRGSGASTGSDGGTASEDTSPDEPREDGEIVPCNEWYWYANMRRSVYIEDNVFSLSNLGIKVNELEDPSVELARVLYRPYVAE